MRISKTNNTKYNLSLFLPINNRLECIKKFSTKSSSPSTVIPCRIGSRMPSKAIKSVCKYCGKSTSPKATNQSATNYLRKNQCTKPKYLSCLTKKKCKGKLRVISVFNKLNKSSGSSKSLLPTTSIMEDYLCLKIVLKSQYFNSKHYKKYLFSLQW